MLVESAPSSEGASRRAAGDDAGRARRHIRDGGRRHLDLYEATVARNCRKLEQKTALAFTIVNRKATDLDETKIDGVADTAF